MYCAKRLLAENLKDGKYKIVKEGIIFNTTICYLSIEKGVWMFTNQSGTHQILPVLKFENAITLTIENGAYTHIAKTALSLWTVRDEVEQKRIINMCEQLVINNVVKIDD